MLNLPSVFLILNGLIGLMIGFLCGAPLGRAIARHKSQEVVHAWRVAHSSLVSGGIMLLAIAPALPYLQLNAAMKWATSIGLSVSLFAFSFALVFGAWQGHRGLTNNGNWFAVSVYYANLLGVLLSMMLLPVLIYGAAKSVLATVAG